MATLVKDCGGYLSLPILATHLECNPSTNILTRIPGAKALDFFLGQRSEQHFSLSLGSRGAGELPISFQVPIVDKPIHGSIPDAGREAK
jgi:hypothetical protein